MKTLFSPTRLVGALALVATLAAPCVASAQADCLKWDFSEPFTALHGDFRVEFRLDPQRPDFGGSATLRTPSRGGGAFSGIETHPVNGTVDRDSIEIRTAWGGVYRGSVDASGRLAGRTIDQANSNSSQADWTSDRPMHCLMQRPDAAGSNDFNGDGRADILWHNKATGEAQIWFLNANSRVARATVTDGTQNVHIGPPWQIVGTRDFDNNHRSDLLWHNRSTGETQLWFMNGERLDKRRTVVVKQGGWALRVGAPWRIVGTNDLDTDGKPDIVWHNELTGEVQVWLMDRNEIVDRQMLRWPLGGNLKIDAKRQRIVAIDDFDDDGRPDLVLHSRVDGGIQVLLMNGIKVKGSRNVVADADGTVMRVGSPWRITGADDFNRDGHGDLLWHNAVTGETQQWLMRKERVLRGRTVYAELDGGGHLVGAPWLQMHH